MELLKLLQSRFHAALDGMTDDAAQFSKLVAPARDSRHGDYQANLAMPLSKAIGGNPREVAQAVVDRLEIDDVCDKVEIAGPGFINLHLDRSFLANAMQHMTSDDRLGIGQQDTKTYVIDYSAPNVAKPMHVGHIRSTVIGDALARLLRFLGHRVIADNHLGDWGTQFGMIIYGYKHFRNEEDYSQSPVKELSRIYRLVQQLIGYQAAQRKLAGAEEQLSASIAALTAAEAIPEEDKKRKKALKSAKKNHDSAKSNLESLRTTIAAVEESDQLLELSKSHTNLEQKAQQETVRLHEGDQENVALWKQFMPISIQEIDAVYKRLDIHFDYTYGESFYHPMLAGVVDNLLQRGLAKEDDGAICLFLDGFDAPMIVRKRDGAFLYATTDIATIEYRMKEFQPDEVLYVVDHRQSEHFDKLFAAARQIGHTDVGLHHISFGTVLGPDGRPFKTRSGSVVGLEYLLDEAIQRAYEVVCNEDRLAKLGLELSDEEKTEIARVVGLGAIKYADLSHSRTSDYTFDIDNMVQLEGDTSTYMQYMYARSQSILRKAELDDAQVQALRTTQFVLDTPTERSLALQLLQLEDALLSSVVEYYPNLVAAYLYGLAKQFAKFFDQCHVLSADSEELKLSRLAICDLVGRVLATGLDLLGINVVKRM